MKIKHFIKSALLSTIAVVALGCTDELDNSGIPGESQPTQSLTNADTGVGSETNLDIPAAFVNGLYAQMIQTGTGGTNLNHDDFGQKGYDIYGDMLCGDMALSVSTYGWYRSNITEFQAPLDFTDGRNRMIWRYYYRIIRSANNIIDNLGGNDAVPEVETNKFSMGQAKTMRAHSYFYLTQYFQKEYVANEEILPMYLSLAVPGNQGKATAEEIYTQMESDLTDAISLLDGFNRSEKNQVNKNVAQGMLAYVLAAKGGRDSEVAALTQSVINSGNHNMLSSGEVTNGFNNVNTSSWIWGIDLTETIGLDLVSWWGQVDAFSYSYAWAGDYKVIDKSLFDAIPTNDARKAQFLDDATDNRYLQPFGKFFASNVIGGTSQVTSADYVYMRIEEMYLLNAEVNARMGAVGPARNSLKALVSRRVPSASYIDALDGSALLNEIYLQTRIEMWGEGKSFLAMKRFKATTTRGSNHLSFVGVPIPYNDERMQFEIPLDEIQNNPFLSEQNQ